MQIFGRNLFWYAAVFGTITAISRAAVTDELLVLDPEGAMSLVVQHTHYLPKRWRGKENSELVRMEFETLFQYTGMMLLEEIASIFLTPCLLLFVVPKRVDDILQFIEDFTVHVEGVGHVCSFSVFDFQNHGNSIMVHHIIHLNLRGVLRVASTSELFVRYKWFPWKSELYISCTASHIGSSYFTCSFQSSYPSWEPDAQGKQFLSTLRTFREEKLQGHGTRPAFSPPRIWRGSPNLRGQIDRNGLFLREMLQNSPRIGYQSGSLWLIDADQKSHPYLLDWYYTSRPHAENGNSNDIPRVPYEVAEEHPKDFWMPSNFNQREVRYDGEFWHHQFDDRSQSHLEASTSGPFFRESVLQHHDSGHVSTLPRAVDKSLEEGQGQDLDWRKFHKSLDHEQHLEWRKSHKSPDHEQQQLDWREPHKSLDHEQHFDWRDSHNSLGQEQQVDRRNSHKTLDEDHHGDQYSSHKSPDEELF
ncbi:Autophagy-related protein 9 [Vitis vinifera]|uniref:Autophagy-related protein 9 n=1 Tax=Vitis vinifera TaxID=29760 RepID=A0A438KDB9_VITVI|nr:Autophagy-related protein 9 [Vitis vinifera]